MQQMMLSVFWSIDRYKKWQRESILAILTKFGIRSEGPGELQVSSALFGKASLAKDRNFVDLG
jgi:hypothetical protein